ncbi:MAG: myosin heavy subunit [Paraglaciecola sp.]|jgi:myosin heavy subunit
MSTSKANSQRLIAIVAVVVVVLLTINAFLLYNKIQQDKVITQQETEISEAEKLSTELEKQYHESLSELEEMRGTNEEMDALIDQQKIELAESRNKISRLIKDGKNLKNARQELNGMKLQMEQYLSENEMLKGENKQLKGETRQLKERSRVLEDDLASTRMTATQLETEKSQLSTEKQAVEAEKNKLANTVKYASVIDVKSVSVAGMKIRSNGKAVKKKYAKNIDQLKVCFQTTANDITRPGVEKFYVRIMSPLGETLAVEELGSGIIIDKKTGKQVKYTQVKEYEYANDETQLCFKWEPNVPFQRGKYQVEIYNKGHVAGEGKFELK